MSWGMLKTVEMVETRHALDIFIMYNTNSNFLKSATETFIDLHPARVNQSSLPFRIYPSNSTHFLRKYRAT